MAKIWKPIKLKGVEWLDDLFQVSEYGDVERVYPQGNFPVPRYENSQGKGLEVKFHVHSNLINKTKNIYVSHLVALHFLPCQFGAKVKSLEFVDPDMQDDYKKYHYTNLKAVFTKPKRPKQEQIKLELESKRTIKDVKTPEINLNEMVDLISTSRDLKMKRGTATIPYYSFVEDAVYSNRSHDIAKQRSSLLQPIVIKFREKLAHDKLVMFKNLTDVERQEIRNMIPKKVFNPIKRW